MTIIQTKTSERQERVVIENAAKPEPQHLPAATNGKSVVRDMADRYGMEQAAFQHMVMDICFPPKKDERQITAPEFAAFLLICKEYNLNPLTREIYGFRAKSGVIVPVVGVDGWARIINEKPDFDGVEFDDHLDGQNLTAITCRIYHKNRSRPTEVTEYMVECKRGGDVWEKWPRRMLRHKALIQCARYAFGFSGIYDPDEAERINEGSESQVVVASKPPMPPPPSQAALPAPATAPVPPVVVKRDDNDPDYHEMMAAQAEATGHFESEKYHAARAAALTTSTPGPVGMVVYPPGTGGGAASSGGRSGGMVVYQTGGGDVSGGGVSDESAPDEIDDAYGQDIALETLAAMEPPAPPPPPVPPATTESTEASRHKPATRRGKQQFTGAEEQWLTDLEAAYIACIGQGVDKLALAQQQHMMPYKPGGGKQYDGAVTPAAYERAKQLTLAYMSKCVAPITTAK